MNAKSILLAYASRYGSTEEVAKAISSALRETVFEVDLKPMRDVKALDHYDAVVLGAAIYNTRLHPDVHQFLSQNQETLMKLPVAIFALGPVIPGDIAKMRSRRQLDKDLLKYPWLKPVALEIFVGKYDPSKLSFFERFSPASDNRDWDAIRAWANSLPVLLQDKEAIRSA